jgi:hypothetical protein
MPAAVHRLDNYAVRRQLASCWRPIFHLRSFGFIAYSAVDGGAQIYAPVLDAFFLAKLVAAVDHDAARIQPLCILFRFPQLCC